jgi:phenylalanyl-tRNA synthetase beta chain
MTILSLSKFGTQFSFLLQDENQTLNDKMIDKIMSKLVKNLEDKLGAKLR